jgi:hypothetical protein
MPPRESLDDEGKTAPSAQSTHPEHLQVTRGVAMQQRILVLVLSVLVVLVAPYRGLAQGRAEGAIVIRDGAPIYVRAKGSAIADMRARGDSVGGVTTMLPTITNYQFEDEDGRLHVGYFRDKDQKGLFRVGWMDPADLARFTYECGCGPRDKACAPTSTQGFVLRWNTCFVEARDRKLAELRAHWEGQIGSEEKSLVGTRGDKAGEKPLTNDDIVAMTKALLGDDIIISKIQQTTASFDTSADALIRLKKAGVSKLVLDAMLKNTSSPEGKKPAESQKPGVDAVAVGGRRLVLNGSGLRRRMGLVLYEGRLYLESKTSDASVVTGSEQAKRLVLHVLIAQIPKDQVASSLNKGFKENSPAAMAALKESIQRFLSWMETVHAEDEIVMTYVPGAGTTLSIAGGMKGTIEGKDFADALFSVWFGKEPVDDDLKKGMLGQG